MLFLFLCGFIFGGSRRHSDRFSMSTSDESIDTGADLIAYHPFGLRVDARTLTKENYQKYFDGKHPVILRNYFKVDNDKWTEEMMTTLGDGDIEYDVRHSSDGLIESYEATFNEFLDSLPENSDHDENLYLMNEDLLQNQTNLLEFLQASEGLFGNDLFKHFPEKIRPYQALIVGGIGARSFLHCDPYEWMGINYLFEGRKLWTFLSPDVPSKLFDARRTAPDAWGAYNISAGWVSDTDLYRHRQSFALGALANAESKIKPGSRPTGGGGLDKIRKSSLNGKWLKAALSPETTGEKNLDVPIFMSGDDGIDYCQDPRLVEGAIQFIQEEGDLVLIPPRYWHQVYHLEPSIALASQYVNDVGKNRTFNHILKWCSGDPKLDQRSEDSVCDGEAYNAKLPSDFASLSEKEQVLCVIQAGLRLQHGRLKGSALMKKLCEKKEI